ncbi:GNAT family N-acetyltransferase [Zhouia spongiae]|uniref:GNAT family N-acetyltransferase n=1 Tax=Zhouia spongiae TaxID=2202721 RepID=A0ABY3YIU2_9FLAO|nr:GNAT family N-acetyltransferase [Zhouia spongiae]UNY97610.1 GNAT family N-acetyltransferase [Zhouia spongiae]
MIFKTKRLTIRLLKKEDLPSFYRLQNSQKVMKYTGSMPQHLAECTTDLKDLITKYSKTNNNFWVWAIENENNIFIGTCAIIFNDKKEWEIGYRFIEDFWGVGYGTEITQGLIEYAFGHLQLKQLKAYVDKRNVGSVKILEKLFNYKSTYWNNKDNCWDMVFEICNI